MNDVSSEDRERAIALYHGVADAEAPALLARLQKAKAVRVVADRVKLTARAPVSHNEALLVAQAAMATGLSPFQPQPELWYWVSQKQGQRVLTMMRGRDGTTRLAQENARRQGTYLMDPKYETIEDEVLKVNLGFEATDLVVLARVSSHQEVKDWYERRKMLKAEGLTSEQIDAKVGAQEPASEGYGRVTISERAKLDKYEKSKFPHINRARKRARAEAEKPWASQLNIGALADGGSGAIDEFVVDAEWREVNVEDLRSANLPEDDDPEGEGPPPEPTKGAAPNAPKAPKAKERAPRPAAQVQPAFLKLTEKHKGLRKNESLAQVVGMHLASIFGSTKEGKTARQAAQLYLSGKPSLSDFTGAELKAVVDLLELSRGEDGKYHPSSAAVQEFKACSMAMAAEEG